MRLYCSFLRACLRLARGIGSLLLALFLHNAVRFLAFPLPFPLPYVAISAATLAFALTLPMLMELLAGTMLAWLSHDRLTRSCKARAKCSNKSKISYFHSFPSFPNFITVIGSVLRSGCMLRTAASSSRNALSFSSALTMKRFPVAAMRFSNPDRSICSLASAKQMANIFSLLCGGQKRENSAVKYWELVVDKLSKAG